MINGLQIQRLGRLEVVGAVSVLRLVEFTLAKGRGAERERLHGLLVLAH